MGLKRAATVGLCPTQHKKHVLLLLVASLLVFYFAKPVLFRLNDLKARDGADGPLQIALAWLKQSLICESEVGAPGPSRASTAVRAAAAGAAAGGESPTAARARRPPPRRRPRARRSSPSAGPCVPT